ncbi:MAG: ChbG/HpnK family deacetylase [Phycisphaerae bacterium]|nr:ChbG/HpnK family deacetylase [Phycisphaerae bacterium]
MPKKMIINADDFGLCQGVNDAVAEAHTAGVLTSTTIMANMPAVDNAITIAKSTPSLGVGIHLNVLQGKPISTDRNIRLLIDGSGQFKYSASKLAVMALTNTKICKAIEAELSAQIASIIDKGLKPTHLDSHKHFHCLSPIWRIVCSLAEKFNISAIRWPWEPETLCGGDWPKVGVKDKFRAYIIRRMALGCQKLDSRFIKTDIFFGVTHTGRIDDKFWSELGQTQFAGIAEVMTHPGYPQGLGKTRLVEQRQVELKWLCAESTKQILAQAGIELIHYGNIDRE